MFDEQWQFAVEVERKYAKYRKKVMVRYDLSAAEVDVCCFLRITASLILQWILCVCGKCRNRMFHWQ